MRMRTFLLVVNQQWAPAIARAKFTQNHVLLVKVKVGYIP